MSYPSSFLFRFVTIQIKSFTHMLKRDAQIDTNILSIAIEMVFKEIFFIRRSISDSYVRPATTEWCHFLKYVGL